MKSKCILCGEEYEGYGHNPDPLSKTGRCCDQCNIDVVFERMVAEDKAKNG